MPPLRVRVIDPFLPVEVVELLEVVEVVCLPVPSTVAGEKRVTHHDRVLGVHGLAVSGVERRKETVTPGATGQPQSLTCTMPDAQRTAG